MRRGEYGSTCVSGDRGVGGVETPGDATGAGRPGLWGGIWSGEVGSAVASCRSSLVPGVAITNGLRIVTGGVVSTPAENSPSL